jgi:site-specific DNA-adenine methylase
MWSYYGRKTKIIKYYPDPIYDYIAEPFAGTAVYSLYKDNWKKKVLLVDTNPIIIGLWEYLQQASPKDVLSLPKVHEGDDIREHTYLCDEERWLMGFWINRGMRSPCYTVTKWAGKNGYWEKKKEEIADNLHKIRHWTIRLKSYTQIKSNRQATWFIDPPYQFGGENYVPKYSNRHIDFNDLSLWCKSRNGQVIVCENTKATWLDFTPLKSLYGQRNKTIEAIYHRQS